MNSLHPFHPIIYVRGFAATDGEIEDCVGDPFMGFNIGSTKSRAVWTGELKKFFFESPVLRLAREHSYEDMFDDGVDLLVDNRPDRPIPYRSVAVYRYYDEASEAFGTGNTPPIEHFARGLSDMILALRDIICANPKNEVTKEDFRVYLVAHSMGGLICRAFMQNPALGDAAARKAVDKLFTYATPHNGIDFRIVRNIPSWAAFGDVNNFNRDRMASFFGLPATTKDVSEVTNFPPDRVFNLVGTNPRDYLVLKGLSSWAAGDASDGLVRIDNATTFGIDSTGQRVNSPRAFVNRSHSGHYGIVNSEEGYQNLTRFFFGKLRVDGILDIDDITLPVEVEKERLAGKNVKASYQFEVAVSLRGSQWQLHRRTVLENSAIFRTYDELFPPTGAAVKPPDRTQSPHLFSVFLDPEKSVKESGSVSFAFDLKIVVPDYTVDGILFLKRHYEGGYIYRELIIVEAFADPEAPGGWRIKYGFQDVNPGRPGKTAETRLLEDGKTLAFDIPIEQSIRPGMKGTLRIEARSWNDAAR